MIAANVVIAINYVLIALLLLSRLRLHSLRRYPWAAVFVIAGVGFFLGCVHTHVDLLWLIFQGKENPHWSHPPTVLSHVAQALGGLVFWWVLRYRLVLNIYDKALWRQGEPETVEQTERRLHYLADKVGLIR